MNSMSQFRLGGRWNNASETALQTTVATSVGTQYVFTMYIDTLTTTMYTYNGTTVSSVATYTLTYSSGGGTNNPLNQLRSLWFGKSTYIQDPYSNATYQKILLYTGSTPTTDLPLLFSEASQTNNTTNGSIYTFGVPNSSFISLSVQTFNSPTITTTQVALNGINQYLALTGLTMLEEDATRIYNANNNVLGTIPSS